MIIAIDFDNTICTDVGFPEIGPPVPLAIDYLKALQGPAKLLLWTLRTGPALKAATDYLLEQGITFWGYNQNPEQAEWNQSPKIYAHLYIDDKNLGIPLINFEGEKVVDWQRVGPLAMKQAHIYNMVNDDE